MTTVQGTIASDERLDWLIAQLARAGAVTIADAAEALAVSEMTVRRDLVELEERGIARRVRGGAKAVGPQTFDQRHHTAGRAKSRIAAKLVSLVPASGAVAFDASSTVMRLASLLSGARDLTVLTNGLDTFKALQDQPGVTALLTGGRCDERTGSLVGPLACLAASQLSVHTFFSSAAAVHAETGAMEATLEEAEVKRSIAAGAGQIVLAADASKLDTRGLAQGLEWEKVDVLVTELDPRDSRLDAYREFARLV